MKNKLIINYIEKCVFYAFIFLIPLQTRKIFYFWGSEFNEWTAVSFYGTDILVLILFVFWIFRGIKYHIAKKGGAYGVSHLNWANILLLVFAAWSGVSVFFAGNFYLGLYHWVKLAEMIFVFCCVGRFLKHNGGNGLIKILWIWVLSAFTQSIIAIAQFFKQSDLGLRIFHESPIGALIDGAAKFDASGLKFIRAYGSFPHPNILAAFLGIGFFFCYFSLLFLYSASRPGRRNAASAMRRIILWLALIVIFTGLFLTFSRSAIFSTIFLSLIFLALAYFSEKERVKKIKILKFSAIFILFAIILFLLLQPLIISRFNISAEEQAVDLRVSYNKAAFDFIKKSPIFGVGIGNFVSTFRVPDYRFQISGDWQYQPAHNLYLLIASETGILGLILFSGFIILLLRNIFLVKRANNDVRGAFSSYILYSIFYILFLGFSDHYFWTLQQGMLTMWMVFGIAAGVQEIVHRL